MSFSFVFVMGLWAFNFRTFGSTRKFVYISLVNGVAAVSLPGTTFPDRAGNKSLPLAVRAPDRPGSGKQHSLQRKVVQKDCVVVLLRSVELSEVRRSPCLAEHNCPYRVYKEKFVYLFLPAPAYKTHIQTYASTKLLSFGLYIYIDM